MALLAFGALELLRSRLEASDALRESLEGAVSAQARLHLEAGAIRVGFWPPELWLLAPVLEMGGGARVELGATRIRIALEPLLGGVADLRELSVDGPSRLVHRGEAIEGRVVAAWTRGEPGAAEPSGWDVRATAELDAGGRLEVAGALATGGRFLGTVEIEDVESGPFSMFLSGYGQRPTELTGRYTGRLDLSDPAAAVSTLRLESELAVLELAQVVLEGPVALVAEVPVARSSGSEAGRFAVDATGARVEYDGGAAKASGRGASVTGRIAWDPSGRVRLEDVRLKVLRFDGRTAPAEGPVTGTGDPR